MGKDISLLQTNKNGSFFFVEHPGKRKMSKWLFSEDGRMDEVIFADAALRLVVAFLNRVAALDVIVAVADVALNKFFFLILWLLFWG